MPRKNIEQIICEALKQHHCTHEKDWGEVKATMRVIRETMPILTNDVKANREAILVIKTEKKTMFAVVSSVIALVGAIIANVYIAVRLYVSFKE